MDVFLDLAADSTFGTAVAGRLNVEPYETIIIRTPPVLYPINSKQSHG